MKNRAPTVLAVLLALSLPLAANDTALNEGACEPRPLAEMDRPEKDAGGTLEATRRAAAALEATREAHYLKELKSLGKRMRKRNIDISSEIGAKPDDLNWDTPQEWPIVAAAALDAKLDFHKLQSRYPEILERGGVRAIEDFDRSATKQVLCQGPAGVQPLRLKILRPEIFCKERTNFGPMPESLDAPGDFQEVRRDFDGFRGDAPVTVFHQGRHVYMRIVAQIREYRPEAKQGGHENFIFFRRVVTLRFSRHKFRTVSDVQHEISRAQWDLPFP